MARHAAQELVTYGEWKDGRPAASTADVIGATGAMYGGYLAGEDITPKEAKVALSLVMTRGSDPGSWEREMAALRQAARDIIAA